MKEFLNKKPVQIVLLILSVIWIAYLVSDFADMAKRSAIRSIVDKIATANDQLNKSTPGIERAEIYIKKLKSIDTSATPEDFRVAISNYVASFESGLNEVKSTHNTDSSFDRQVADNKEIMVQLTKKYLNKYP